MPVNNTGNILKKLWGMFWLSIVLPLILFAGVILVHQLGIRITAPGNIRILGIFLLVFSVAFGVAVPVLLRTSFHGKYVKQKSVAISEYLIYQRTLIAVCSLAIISASIAYLFIVSPLYMYGSILAALYGIYSAIPFKEKIVNELKIYKLENQG
ncbi:MAG: hypothetical protein KAJ19_26630 [Gammaproteobacteria bacterium]|nr:hypothetical protein [Gammaproteobacteria bacterium]